MIRKSAREGPYQKAANGSGGYWRNPDLGEPLALAALQHLYLRYLPRLGDSGTHNILIRHTPPPGEALIAGIDFDEQRRESERGTALGCLFKTDLAYLEAVYGDLVGRIRLPGRVVSGSPGSVLSKHRS